MNIEREGEAPAEPEPRKNDGFLQGSGSAGASPSLPRDDAGPVFKEPWQAHAFALAVRLSEAGHFSWAEWTQVLSREIRDSNEPDQAEHYYHCWLRALERICREKGLAATPEVDRRQQEWRHAYMHTPHGQPVELAAGTHEGL